MKYLKAFLCLLLTAQMLVFASCAADKCAYTVQGEENLSRTEKKENNAAKEKIAKKYGIDDLSKLRLVEIEYAETKGKKTYKYELPALFGYGFSTEIEVYINSKEKITRVSSAYGDDVVYFLDILTQEMVDEAASKLREQLEAYDEDPTFSYYTDKSGYLCLRAEFIRELPATYRDHEHVVLLERICKKPLLKKSKK